MEGTKLKAWNWCTLSAGCAYCYLISRFKQIGLNDGVVHFGLKHVKKAIAANLLASLWALQYRFGLFA